VRQAMSSSRIVLRERTRFLGTLRPSLFSAPLPRSSLGSRRNANTREEGENVCFDTRVTNDFRIYARRRAGRPEAAL